MAKKLAKKVTKKPAKKVATNQAKRQVKRVMPKKPHHYTRLQRVALLVVYAAFASAFTMFASESVNSTWYYVLAVVCGVMVIRHFVGIVTSLGSHDKK